MEDAKPTKIRSFLEANGISQTELGREIGFGADGSTISRKISGSRAWRLSEVTTVLSYLSRRLGRSVSFDEVFGTPKRQRRAA